MKTSQLLAGVVVSTAMLAVPMTAAANFYPADRQTYTCVTPTNCPGADHVVFDSFTNNPVVGDERPFFAGSLNGANVADNINVKDGDVIVLRAYVHNNADATKFSGGEAATVAKNVKIKVLVPTAKQTNQNLVAFISADNANPAGINDTMSLTGTSAFTLEYVAGSAQFAHAADGVNQKTDQLSDNIVTANGASLGDIKGCFAYSGYVTLKVRVHMPTTPTPPVVTPPVVTPPVVTPPTPAAPTKLVNTGPGQVVALFAAVTAAGAFGYRAFLTRRLNQN